MKDTPIEPTLQADVDPPAPRCAADPGVETYLRCGRCDTPICPRCLIMTPVGSRCRACARLRKPPQFVVGPKHYARGLGAALATSTAGSALLSVVPGLGFFGFLLMLGLGYLVGEATTAATNRKRGTGLAAVAALAVPLGLLLARAVLFWVAGGGRVGLEAAVLAGAASLLGSVWGMLLLLAAMAVAFSRVR